MRTPCGIVGDAHRSGLIACAVCTRSEGYADRAVASRDHAAATRVGLHKLARCADALDGQGTIASVGQGHQLWRAKGIHVLVAKRQAGVG